MPNQMKLKLPAVTRANLWDCVILAYLIFDELYLYASVAATIHV